MATFNKIEESVYSSIQNYSIDDSGSINAKYVLGIGSDMEGEMKNFTIIVTEYKYIDYENSEALINAPLSKDDLGKSPQQIMLDRIYKHLKDTNQVVV